MAGALSRSLALGAARGGVFFGVPSSSFSGSSSSRGTASPALFGLGVGGGATGFGGTDRRCEWIYRLGRIVGAVLASGGDVPQAVERAASLVGTLVRDGHLHLVRVDEDAVPLLERVPSSRHQAGRVDEDAVGALVVDDVEDRVLEGDRGVAAGDLAMRQHPVAAARAANGPPLRGKHPAAGVSERRCLRWIDFQGQDHGPDALI